MLWGRDESRISGSRKMIFPWSMWLGSGIIKICSIIQERIWLIISETQVHWSQQGSFLLHSKKPIGRLSIVTHSYSNHELQSLDYLCLPAASLQQVLLSSWLDCDVISRCLCNEMKAKEKGTSLRSCLSYQENIFDGILVENTTWQKDDNVTRLLWCSEPVANVPRSLLLEGPAQVEFPALPLSHVLPFPS